MAQLLVRDVPDDVAAALKKRAAKNGRSAEAELRIILQESLKPASEGFAEQAARFRHETSGRKLVDSTDIIRQARDER